MIGIYNYTVILTYASMISAFIGTSLVLTDRPTYAVFCLIFSCLCDTFDGKIARRKKRNDDEKKFGIQIDSLCDVIAFGMFPAIIVIKISGFSISSIIIGAMYTLNAVIRLAYFNVTEETRQSKENDNRKYYAGMPVTIISLFIAFIWTIKPLADGIGANVFGYLCQLLILVFGILFITPIKVKKPGKTGIIILLLIGFIIFLSLIIEMILLGESF